MKYSLVLLCGISATAHASVSNIFDTANRIQHRQLANHSSSGSVDPGTGGDSNKCAAETDKKAITEECSCGMTEKCAKEKFCWMGMVCKDIANPCSEKQMFCGRYDVKGYEELDKSYKEDFKGGCMDMTTCANGGVPDPDDKRTDCAKFIAMNSEPGKCYAVCTVGMTKETQDSIKDEEKCTDDEKKKFDETTEKNQAALSSGSAVAPTLAVVTTAAIAVFAALY